MYQIDRLVEQSLKQAVKRSLQELSKAINGDSKTDPMTLFSVQIQLQAANERGFQQVVGYAPSMSNLSHSLNVVGKSTDFRFLLPVFETLTFCIYTAKEIISTVTSVQRIRGQVFEVTSSAFFGSSPPQAASLPSASPSVVIGSTYDSSNANVTGKINLYIS